jgi:hypothetical protein
VTIEITNGTSSKTETLKIMVTCKKTKTASIRVTPTPITLTGNVGDTLEKNLTISNLGDLDSTLKYKQYFLSSDEITLPPRLPIPTPLAGATARVQGIIQQPYPDPGDLIPAPEGFLSPLTSRS